MWRGAVVAALRRMERSLCCGAILPDGRITSEQTKTQIRKGKGERGGGTVWGRFYRADPAGNVVGYAGSVTIKINDFFLLLFDLSRVTSGLAIWNRFTATTSAAKRWAGSRWCSTRRSSAPNGSSLAVTAPRISVSTRCKRTTPNAAVTRSPAQTNAIRQKSSARNSSPTWKRIARLLWSPALSKRPDADSRYAPFFFLLIVNRYFISLHVRASESAPRKVAHRVTLLWRVKSTWSLNLMKTNRGVRAKRERARHGN